uniref:Uncharacterized protein n=1 Tax=Macaca fascicularis TaxID=9541 RepID=A0A7N9IEQ5_MACFA
MHCLTLCIFSFNGSWIHVQNMQVCYIVVHTPWWFAEPINPSSILEFSFTSI